MSSYHTNSVTEVSDKDSQRKEIGKFTIYDPRWEEPTTVIGYLVMMVITFGIVIAWFCH